MYLHIKERDFWLQMWRDTQQYVVGCHLCHRTNHQSSKPMGLLQPHSIAKARWPRVGIAFITDLPTWETSHDSISAFIDYITKRAHWRAYTKTIDALAIAQIFLNHIVWLHGVP
jgi:hypothetical protein